MVDITIRIDDKELGKLVNRQHAIMCSGASSKSNPVAAIVESVKMVMSAYDQPESYVLCPRLKSVCIGSGSEVRCFEGEPDTYKAHDSVQGRSCKVCPYYCPKDKRQ